jgi:succinate dehydrogenase / fumarate reductase, membrane anchor subunit
MAARPKTLKQARATYNTNWELAWWVFMRISGFLLIFLVFAHIFFNNIQINVASVNYAYVAKELSKAWVKVYESFLLGLAMLHGTNGLRYSIEDYFRRPGTRFWLKAVLFTLAGLLFVIGVMALWAFSYQQMSTAINAASHGG